MGHSNRWIGWLAFPAAVPPSYQKGEKCVIIKNASGRRSGVGNAAGVGHIKVWEKSDPPALALRLRCSHSAADAADAARLPL